MTNTEDFSKRLFEIMKQIYPAVNDLELYEFRYGLQNLTPEDGWESVQPGSHGEIEARVQNRAFYDSHPDQAAAR